MCIFYYFWIDTANHARQFLAVKAALEIGMSVYLCQVVSQATTKVKRSDGSVNDSQRVFIDFKTYKELG